MKSKKLTQSQRLITAILYIAIIVLLYGLLNGGLFDLMQQTEPVSIWFFSGILLVILGKYVTEPYFSSPSDILTNSLSLLLTLFILPDKTKLYGYWILMSFALLLFLLSLFHIVFKDRNTKFKNISYSVLKRLGKSSVLFSAVYLLSSFSFFSKDIPMLFASILIWIFMIPIDSLSYFVSWICELTGIIKNKVGSTAVGISVRSESNNRYTVSVSKSIDNESFLSKSDEFIYIIKTDLDSYRIALETKRIELIDSFWIELLLLEEYCKLTPKESNEIGVIKTENEIIGTTHVIATSKSNDMIDEKLCKSKVYSKRNDLLGFVMQDSNLNVIKFSLSDDNERRLREGSIVQTSVLGECVLYQVINAITKTERLRSDNDVGYIYAVARKLGKYDYDNNELSSVNWTPNVNEAVYINNCNEEINLKDFADSAIGRLPGSDMKIPIKDIDSLITHNTAILGVLGVGKSRLTFELINKIVKSNKKVICFDITNQYASENGLYQYISETSVQKDVKEDWIRSLNGCAEKRGGADKPDEWGNVEEFKKLVDRCISDFFDQNDIKILVINPDNYTVKRAAQSFKISSLIDMSMVEKVKVFSEAILKKCMQLGQIDQARCCVVYEEAHSLTPEFNSVVIKDDSNHANGTAKVIMQGRKFGLGCIIVTQRTANVTKSILNQCNTIFALRVFDDTGKTFLENYIGKEYSDTLPTLEERHAIAIGKGIGLKQPVIIQLNNSEYITK